VTNAETSEYANLVLLEEKIRVILREANEQTRQSENIQKLIEVAMILDVSDISDLGGSLSLAMSQRVFVSLTNVRYTYPGEVQKEGGLFLFNDVIILAKTTPKKKKYRGRALLLIDTLLFRSSLTSPTSVVLLSSEQTVALEFDTESDASKWRKKATEIAESRVRDEIDRVGEQGTLDQTLSRDVKISENITLNAPFPIERVQLMILTKRLQAIQEQAGDLPRSLFSTKIPSPRRGKKEIGDAKAKVDGSSMRTPPHSESPLVNRTVVTPVKEDDRNK
jgi:hypothetical protein